ncbi:hypothetical protein FG386_000767 [Cryptosporidium ryanae]|uniref:uncharacterized protein n=1 Tax=Cryptosporidium ryanae TaxID=515981 RepID=UPI00351A5C86|nr:hypothetical protein FG386_000767 [Cryptosporidium ryanae]
MFKIAPICLNIAISCFLINCVICNGPTSVNEFLPFVSVGSAFASSIFTLSNSIVMYKKANEMKRRNKGFSEGLSQSITKNKESKLRGKVFIEVDDEKSDLEISSSLIKVNDTMKEVNITELTLDFELLTNISMMNSSIILRNITIPENGSNLTNSNYSSKINFMRQDSLFGFEIDNFIDSN